MSIQFRCPKCGQKLTLTASKPGDWLDCPNCEAAVQVPGAVPPKPTPAPPHSAPAPRVPVAQTPPQADDDLDFLGSLPSESPARTSDAPASLWSDKRVQLGAIAGVMGLLVAVLLVLALTKKNSPEQVRNDPPPATQSAPVTPPVAPANTPVVAPPGPVPTPPVKPKDDSLAPVKPKDDPLPKPKADTSSPDPKAAPPPKPKDTPRPPNYTKLDQFGNPVDQNTGLAHQGEFKGQRLLFWCAYKGGGGEDPPKLFGPDNPLWKALEDKGFTIRREFGRFDADWLKEADQCWLMSGASPSGLDQTAVAAIEKFVDAGKGLCLLADNDPYTAEADQLGQRLFGVRVQGNSPATKIAYVKNGQLTPEQIKKFKGDYAVDEHPLLAGVNFVYEGITISNVSISDKLEVALRGSDGKPVVALSKSPKRRVVIDCGFTRYYYSPNPGLNFIEKTAGTVRLAQNMAASLAGKDSLKTP